MTSRKLIPSILVVLLSSLFLGAHPAAADSSHARIIRLSLVQGDVRFARETHGDPLADSKAGWENAELNLPIRQGYVLATDKGRVEVEFENGAMAFLKENTVLEFYDLSLNDGARTTRLVLRQGSASFYVNPASGDYFSVTGGDFTVEAEHRSTFRVDNYDDGSTVETYQGRVSVLHNKNSTRLEKGQSLSVKERDVSSNAGTRGGTPELTPVEHLQKWDVLKSPPRESLSGSLAAAAPPTRVSRTELESKSGIRTGSLGKDSSIAYDPSEHRFVNTNSPAASSSINEKE